jgi:hypothetical protein
MVGDNYVIIHPKFWANHSMKTTGNTNLKFQTKHRYDNNRHVKNCNMRCEAKFFDYTYMCEQLNHLIHFCFLQKHIMIHKGTKKEDTNHLFLLLIIIANQIMTFAGFPSLPILPHEFNHSMILLHCARTQTAKRPLHLSTLWESPTQKV